MTANTEYIFNTNAIAHLKDGVSAVATSATLYPGEVTAFLPGWESGKEFFCTIANAAGDVEVVKVTNITNDTLTIARNQDGGGASEFAAGCPITQRLEGLQLTRFIQREAFRTIAYNPNGVLSAAYPGEKVYQTGLVDCQIRWWKHSTGVLWRLIASGALCDYDYYGENGYIYSVILNIVIFGGVSGSLNLDTDAFDTTLQSWAALGDMIAPARYKNGGAKVGDYVYSFGGVSGSDPALLDNDEYGYDAWAAKTNLPSPARYSAVCCGFATSENPSNPKYRGFAVGGIEGGGSVMNDTDQYDASLDSWSNEEDYPAPTRAGLFGDGGIVDKLVIVAGSAGASWYQDTDVFETGDDEWSSSTDMPVPARRDAAASSYDNELYVFGGKSAANTYIVDSDVFTERPSSWAAITDLSSPARNSSGAGTYGDYIYIMSGVYSGGTSYDNDKYDPAGDSYTADTDVPAPDRRDLSAVGYI